MALWCRPRLAGYNTNSVPRPHPQHAELDPVLMQEEKGFLEEVMAKLGLGRQLGMC